METYLWYIKFQKWGLKLLRHLLDNLFLQNIYIYKGIVHKKSNKAYLKFIMVIIISRCWDQVWFFLLLLTWILCFHHEYA